MKAMVKKTGGFPYEKIYIIEREDGVALMECDDGDWDIWYAYKKKHAKKMRKVINKGELPLGKCYDFCFGKPKGFGGIKAM